MSKLVVGRITFSPYGTPQKPRWTEKQLDNFIAKVREANTPNCPECGTLLEPRHKKCRKGQTNYYICPKCSKKGVVREKENDLPSRSHRRP